MAHGNICDLLRERIKSCVHSKDESLRWFARQTQVDYSTIYRVQSGEQKRISFSNAYKILKFVEPNGYLSILSDYFPSETKSISPDGRDREDDKLLMAIAESQELYRIYASIAPKKMTQADVRETYGSDGLQKVQKLLTIGLLIEGDDGKIRDNLGSLAFPEALIAKIIANHNLSLISLDNPGSTLENAWGATTESGLKDIYYETIKYREKVLDIIATNPGEIVVLASAICGTME